MPNPPLLICDADAVIQIFVARFVEPLRCLRTKFGIQPAVVEEVEVELRSHKRHPNVRDEFAKAVAKGVIVVMTQDELRTRISSLNPARAKSGADALWGAASSRGVQYELRVDRGEAYTFAMAVELAVPAMSNDGRSLRAMRTNGLIIPSPVLRAFDLFALAVQTGAISAADFDKARGRLMQANERPPGAFANCGFAAGVATFEPRIVDSTAPVTAQGRNPLMIRPVATKGEDAPTQPPAAPGASAVADGEAAKPAPAVDAATLDVACKQDESKGPE